MPAHALPLPSYPYSRTLPITVHLLPNPVQHDIALQAMSSFHMSTYFLTLSNIPMYSRPLSFVPSFKPGPCLHVHVLPNLVQHTHELPALVFIPSYTPGPCLSAYVFPILVQHSHALPALVLILPYTVHQNLAYLSMSCLTLSNITMYSQPLSSFYHIHQNLAYQSPYFLTLSNIPMYLCTPIPFSSWNNNF
jgi:hypothetical protein